MSAFFGGAIIQYGDDNEAWQTALSSVYFTPLGRLMRNKGWGRGMAETYLLQDLRIELESILDFTWPLDWSKWLESLRQGGIRTRAVASRLLLAMDWIDETVA